MFGWLLLIRSKKMIKSRKRSVDGRVGLNNCKKSRKLKMMRVWDRHPMWQIVETMEHMRILKLHLIKNRLFKQLPRDSMIK